ncbi:hypothetical protein ABI59_08140 [Acidobacteria bacterium Mor1]|nr:hypothetical protein ABI59_08140 [Acidobacteria bacterium Mor1]
MPRALFVIYDFPPATSSGVFRPLRLLRHLPEHGWDATVITARVSRGRRTDPALSDRIPESTRVIRTRAPEPRIAQLLLMRLGLGGAARWIDRWSRVPDPQRLWVGPATRAALAAIRAEPHDLVWTTSSPYSAHLVGLRLRRACGLPWIADFRDEWTTHPDVMALLPTAAHRRLHQRLEGEVLAEADHLTGVSKAFVDDLLRTAQRPPDGSSVIPNGFDEADFASDPPAPSPDRFVVCYPGMVYGRGPFETFLSGVRQAIERGPIPAERLRLEFIGHGNLSLSAPGLPEGVFVPRGQSPHDEATRSLRAASLLLLLADPERGPGLFPGKIFPFLASDIPVLALIRADSAAGQVLAEGGNADRVDPDDAAGVAEALVRRYRAWERRETPAKTDPEVVARYSSRTQTRHWVELFDRVRQACGNRSA